MIGVFVNFGIYTWIQKRFEQLVWTNMFIPIALFLGGNNNTKLMILQSTRQFFLI